MQIHRRTDCQSVLQSLGPGYISICRSPKRGALSIREGEYDVSTDAGRGRSSWSQSLADLGEAQVATGLFHDAGRSAGVPPLGENEYWIARAEVAEWLADGVVYLVSPLDSANKTEVELSDEQEVMLNWLDKNRIQHVRVVE